MARGHRKSIGIFLALFIDKFRTLQRSRKLICTPNISFIVALRRRTNAAETTDARLLVRPNGYYTRPINLIVLLFARENRRERATTIASPLSFSLRSKVCRSAWHCDPFLSLPAPSSLIPRRSLFSPTLKLFRPRCRLRLHL